MDRDALSALSAHEQNLVLSAEVINLNAMVVDLRIRLNMKGNLREV